MPRLFFALWPDEGTRDALDKIIAAVPAKAGKVLSREKWHITLLFLGSVAPDLTASLQAAAGGVRTEPFSLVIDKPGWWPKPKVLWLGVSVIPPELRQLVDQLNQIAAQFDLPVDSRPYEPHLTYARKANRPLLNLEFAPVTWQIREFCLVESNTYPEGAEYRVLKRWPLTSA